MSPISYTITRPLAEALRPVLSDDVLLRTDDEAVEKYLSSLVRENPKPFLDRIPTEVLVEDLYRRFHG